MYKVEKFGKGGISAKIVADSINENGNRITTYELEYHRYIHGEVMTHRLFSRNAMSSRAVPVLKMIEQSNVTPIHFGKNQSGMQAFEEHENTDLGKEIWEEARNDAILHAKALQEHGFHKQIVNRLLEPFQMMKIVLTATEFENFFWLRCDTDAQPEIQELARLMFEAREESKPELLKAGEWHTPYVTHIRFSGVLHYTLNTNYETYTGDQEDNFTKDEAIAISSSCCAQVSYRNIDNSYDKAMMVYDRLGVGGSKIHASPFEHVATPLPEDYFKCSNPYLVGTGDIPKNLWLDGITHMDKKGNFWSGNLKGWKQHRQLLKNHTKW